jgi:signal transduction histidine kinase
VRVDPGKLQQILVNLLSNAVKFTPPGGRVTIGAALDADGEPTFTVSDTGIGMAPEDIAVALRPFERVRANALVRDAGGIGLGLPISQALVALHGGRLVIDSSPGRGTTIRVVLPRARLVRAAGAKLAPTAGA